MQAVLEPISKQHTDSTRASRGGELLTLHGVSFGTFTRLVEELDDTARPRLSYDHSTLELRMPSEEHEELNRIAALLVALVLGEWDIEARDLGSMTHQEAETEKGFEPDTCFYVDEETNGGNVSHPLLAIEMEVTNSALNKLPIYAAFGMPEIWRLSLSSEGVIHVRFYLLQDGSYVEGESSVALPSLTTETLTGFLRSRLTTERLGAWIKSVQQWARENSPV